MLIGYARVSTVHQSLDRQIAALRAAGCSTIFREKASGKTTKGRPQLEKAIDALGEGDTLIVAEWDRATRSMFDGLAIIQRIATKKAIIKVLDRHYLDLSTDIGRGILALLSSLAEDERKRILRRASEGRVTARKRGVRFGRKPILTDHQKALARDMLANSQSVRTVARAFNCSRMTISRLSAEDRQ